MILDHHGLELVVGFNTRQLELLDDVGDFLESVLVIVFLRVVVGDYQESRPLKEHNFVCVQSLAECLKILLQGLDVW